MRKIWFLGLAAALYACGDQKPPATTQSKDSSLQQQPLVDSQSRAKDSALSWIGSFRQLRDALYQRKKEEVKSFFSFPVQMENNELWFLVSEEFNNGSRPFTEADFNKYYDKILPSALTKTILKIHSEDLFQKGEAQSPSMKQDDSSTVQLYTNYDHAQQQLVLNLAFVTKMAGEEDNIEHNLIYTFSILPNGRLRFLRLNMAG